MQANSSRATSGMVVNHYRAEKTDKPLGLSVRFRAFSFRSVP